MTSPHTALNVLVIDDDEGLRKLVVEIVTSRGHQAICAESAEEGLSLLPLWTFQVAFLDHNLPGMEGLLLGEYLRSNNPDMTIALVTGEDDPRLERRTRDLHIAFVPKPFEVEDISRILDAYIEAAAERDQQRSQQQAEDYAPPFSHFAGELEECYAIPKVPRRIEERLVETVKRCINNLRSAARYTERERVIALSGLLTARVLGVTLPRASSGRTLYEEYDEAMRERGRRTEFGG